MNLSDPDVRRFFEYCAERSRHRPKTLIRFIQMEMKKKQGVVTPLSKLIECFNALKASGIVSIVGSGPNAEVHWNQNIMEVGQDALAGRLNAKSASAASSDVAATLLHIDFPRDNGSIVRLELPPDQIGRAHV